MKRLTYLLIFCFSITLYSCQIREEATFKEDFSGSYAFSIDLKELMSQLLTSKIVSNSQDADSFNPTAQFKKVILEGGLETIAYINIDSIEQAIGISNLTVFTDSVNFSITISFDFDDLSKLNEFYAHLNRNTSGDEPISKNTYVFNKEDKIFTFTQTAKSANGEGSGAPKAIFNNFQIYTKYIFPFNITEVNDTLAVLDKNILELSLPYDEAFKSGRQLVIKFE